MNLFNLRVFLNFVIYFSASVAFGKVCERRGTVIVSAISCRNCHLALYKEWSSSRHQLSYKNAIFQKGYQQEPDLRCLKCHLPLDEQRSALTSPTKENLTDEGVNCQACHQPNLQNSQILKDSFFCAKCHQFKFGNSEVYAQQTYNEWLKYKKGGGTKTCQNCHMPEGSHEFHGPHTYKKSLTSLEIKIAKQSRNWLLQIFNSRAGHNVPTGDVYRYISVEGQKNGVAGFEIIAQFGRNPFWQRNQNGAVLIFKNNNSLEPLEKRFLTIPKSYSKIQIIYHFEAPWAGISYGGKESLEQKVIFSSDLNSHF